MSNPALRDHGKLPGGESRRKSSLVSEPGRSEKRQRRQNSTSKGPEAKVQEEVKEFKGFGSTPGPPGGQGGDTGRSRKQERGGTRTERLACSPSRFILKMAGSP